MLRSNSGNFYIIIGNIPDSDIQQNSLGSNECEDIVMAYVSQTGTAGQQTYRNIFTSTKTVWYSWGLVNLYILNLIKCNGKRITCH